MDCLSLFVYIYLLLKPYYLFESGGLQISDFFLIFSFLVFLLIRKNSRKYEVKKKVLIENRNFLFFVILCFCINFIYYISYPDIRFVMSTLYFIFNLFAIYIFSYCINSNEKFASVSFKIFSFNILIQFILCVLNFGKFWDSTRYMGTFNDPNQFAYYILLTYSFTFLLNKCKKQKYKYDNTIVIILLILSLYLVFKSLSTGIILGFSVLIILNVLEYIRKPFKFIKKNLSRIIIISFFAIPISIIVTLIKPELLNSVKNNVFESGIFNRVTQKIEKISTTGNEDNNIWQDRALDYIIYYPQYLIIGSGEGGENRFPKVNHYTEIHSTFPAILFYYGIFPTILLFVWIINKLKGLNLKYLTVYIALIAESFTLANQRQALFWIIFCIAVYLKKESKKDEKMSNCLLDR